VPEPFVFYDSKLYRMVMYSEERRPMLVLTQKDKGTVVEFQDGDVCRLVSQVERFHSGNPWEDMIHVDSYLTTFDFQSSGMIH
jgi:hypothetical protein